MKLVVIESPFGSDDPNVVDGNIAYLRRAMHDCLTRGEAPYASHGLYTQDGVLDDNIPEERELGINAGFEWGKVADKRIFYLDRGMSKGMKYGLLEAKKLGQVVEFRYLDVKGKNEVDVALSDEILEKYAL